MNLVTLDFETYYNNKEKYSLKHMTAEEYIRDPRFQIVLLGLKFNDREAFWISGTHEYLKQKLSQILWDKVVCLGHNISGFDALILTEVLGIRPSFWQDTMCIGRALHGGISVSLANLAHHYLLPKQKGNYVANADGKRREDFTEQELSDYGDYCKDDCDICYALYQIMRLHMPAKELRQVHLFTRMFGEPRLELDVEGLDLMVKQLRIQKQNLLEQCQVTESQLRSDAKFAQILESMGVEPGQKQNKKLEWKYAFAKTDPFMKDLQDHPDQRVRLLAAARLKTKTTIEESRAQRFLDIGQRGKLPALLNYGKTLTHRASGGGGINLQNLKQPQPVTAETLRGALLQTSYGRQTLESFDAANKVVMTQEGHRLDLKSKDDTCHVYGLRDAIRAPDGYMLVPCDSSNIELRVAHLLAGQMDTIERIRNGEDLYCWFAEDLYGRPITKADNSERQHGKVGMLQLQFQSGAVSLQSAARVMGGIILSFEEAQATVDMFRNKFPELPRTWYRCQDAIYDMYYGRSKYIDQWGLCYTEHNAIVLPNGLRLIYTNLRHEYDEVYEGWQWVYDDKETRKPKKLYGGAVFANMVQALARIVVFDQTLVIEKQWGGPDTGVALIVHDEAVTVVREPDAMDACNDIVKIMSKPPAWWLDLPVAAKAGFAKAYGAAK